jgi:hypothetical protein
MFRSLQSLVVLLLGYLLGILSWAALSSWASAVFIDEIRLQYAFEQKQMGIEAARKADWESAIRYFDNTLDADARRVQSLAAGSKVEWGLIFPLAAVILRNVASSSEVKLATANRWSEGVGSAVKALAYEQLGRTGKADEEFARAKKLLKVDDTETVKQLARQALGLGR